MKTASIALGALVSVICFAGCNSNQNPTVHNESTTDNHKKTLEDESSLCNPNCEQIAYAYIDPHAKHPIGLQPVEATSLKAALASTQVSGNRDKLHIHADAINGKLIFLPDSASDPASESHVSGNEVSLSNPKAQYPPIKVVATPAALALMQQRVTPSGHSQ